MVKKVLVAIATSALIFCGIATLNAADKGPAEITIENPDAKKPKPAYFPHKAHQDAGLACAECHHGMGDDGAQVAYEEGQAIQKCAECHNSDVLAGKTKGKDKLDTLKGAFHANCLACHKEVAEKDEAKKDLKKCSTCHKK
ncbi:cytochrome c3 family protein [Desulfosediminicola sp.]|uniref:cytochrome c3 family protein n=1 Tax=Desulfosediminicola sp. TaxID=2886825 RepID=UPI003AF21E30